MKNKYCRICWNTNGWRKPSGAATESGGSYFALHGFGHEEWIFNYEWCIDGYKYSFLQPIHKYRQTFEGQTFAAALYTKAESRTMLVATISQIHVPPFSELNAAFQRMQENGWIDQMREDVTAVGGQLADLESPTPELIINVRFKPDDVILFNPLRLFPPDHKINSLHRYHAYDWNEEDILALEQVEYPDSDPTRSELQHLRAAQQATTVDPKHVRLQNQLYESLCKQYGVASVGYEQDFVDLRVKTSKGCTFFEIKTDSSAKICIRKAIGQLIEYSMYPRQEKANQLVVVGDAPANSDDVAYLHHLRSRFSIPIYYAQFNWQHGEIGIPM